MDAFVAFGLYQVILQHCDEKLTLK